MKQENKKTEKVVKSQNKNLKVKIIPMVTVLIALIVVAIILGIQSVKTQGGVITAELAKARTYKQVEEGDEIIEEAPNVRFDAFFLRDLNNDGYAESIRGTCREIGEEDTLYMELNVQTEGYLKEGKITINGENFYLQTALPKDEELKDNYIGNNVTTIEFNDITNGTQKMLTGVVRSGDYTYTSEKAVAIGKNINNYSKVNSVTLTGIYVNAEGEETPISKTVEFDVDWYGQTKASIYTTNQSKNIDNAIDEENRELSLDFTVYTEETDRKLILSKNHVEGEIPTLNEYAPIRVEYTGTNGVFTYDAETRSFRIDREAVAEENGEVTTSLSRSNSYGIRVVYPLEAYQSLGTETVSIKIPVRTYYEGYNNPSEEFTNPYRSNIASATIVVSYEKERGTVSEFEVIVGKRVYDPSTRYIVSKEKPLRIYNGISEGETGDTYTVLWEAYIGTGSGLPGIIMKETKNGETQVTDTFIKTDATEESTDDVVANVGIYFSGADKILGEEGWIKVYDEETGDLIVTFTASDWNKYTSGNPYRYEIPVKHVRIETSNVVEDESYLYTYHIKEIEDDKITEKYERQAFDTLQYIKSTLVGYLGESYVDTDTHQANYEAPISVAEVSISKNTLSTQTTEKNDRITIDAVANASANQVAWQNGMFLVKLPKEIIDAQINNVEILNSNVSLESYELIEQEEGLFIKIVTKNDTPMSYSINIDVDLTPDPRIATVSRSIELYASNENGADYYYKAKDQYDVNNNLNTEENVNYDTASISMVSPNSLLTNQTASEYDNRGSEVVSPEIADIKPVYAIVDQETEEQTVKIGVQIKNNYASTISEIKILGKIPFEGNSYVLSGGDLGSTFTTKMINTGIEIPEELQAYATVYYSEKENPSNDRENAEDGWKTAEQVSNWDNIKSYMIDLGDYVMDTGKEYVFYYTVKIPHGLEFNKVAYSHHGVYFCLDTDQGKYRTQTEPNKLGLRIAEKYNLGLTKYQIGKDKFVPGATYSITDVATGETKTGVTNAQGTLNITNLYAEKEYEIREIKTPDDYELNEEVIRFIGHVDEEGTLSVEVTSGTPRGEVTVSKEAEEDYKVGINVEDEAKATLKIEKKEEGTETAVQGVRFKVTGKGLSESGKTATTNANGEISIKGLSINQEYTLEEVRVPEGYYFVSPIKFTIVNENGNYRVNFVEGTESITSNTITEEDSIPTLHLTIENEKIPTYSLQLVKVERTTESTLSTDELMAKAETNFANTEVEYLAGAKFKLYKGTEEVGEYITDETGTVTIEGLYQYEEEKGIDQTYTLKEVLAPAGYAKVKDIVFEVEEIDGKLVLRETNEAGEETESTRYTTEGNTIKLVVEDSPSFKLIKKDAETKEVLAGIKFAIYNVDDGTEQLARNSKGEIIGTKETIKGREYYVVETDEKGELTADLPEGLYKAVEVEAPEKYNLAGQIYYFGIGASREAPTTIGVTQATSIGGSRVDRINSVAATSDGGYIVGGYFESSSITVGDYTLINAGSRDGMLIKYGSEGEVEWARSVGGNDYDYIHSVAATSDGGYIVGGRFGSGSITIGEYTLTNTGNSNGMVIKYDSEGEVEWARSIVGSDSDHINSVAATSDGGYIVGGDFYRHSITIGEYTLTNAGSSDGMVIKYDSEGEVEWASSIGGSGADYINSVTEISDGGYIVGGYFHSESIMIGEYTITNTDYSSYYQFPDGMVIKYSSNGEVKWASSIGGSRADYINSVTATSDGGYIVGGYFTSEKITVGDHTLTKPGSVKGGMVIKYSSNGAVKWARSVRGSQGDYINSVAATSDGGCIVGGYFTSEDITVGDYTLTNAGNNDGMIIKYSSSGKVEWATSIGGSDNDYINSVTEISDGGYIVGGYFRSSSITVGDYTLINAGNDDGMVIKYEKIELNNPITLQAQSIGGSNDDAINSVAATNDGGYIVGGYFSSSITVGEYTLTNARAGRADGMVIKYDSEGEVEWARSVGGSNDDSINSVAATSDGGYIVGGYFESSSITIGEYTITNASAGYADGMVIKYDSEGEVEWARSVGGSVGGSNSDYINSVAATSDGGYIVGGHFESSSITVGEYTLTNARAGHADGMVIKYDSKGEVEWARSVGGSNYEYINSVAGTSDGGYIVGGYFTSSSITIGEYTLTNAGNYDGMVIKYDSKGEVEWARSVGGSGEDRINSVAATSDGGYIVGGYFGSNSITVGDYTLTRAGYNDGMVIKYDSEGEVEWARSVGGSHEDRIHSVAATSDGGYIVGGDFRSSSITVGDYTLTKSGNDDGMVIKYGREGKVEWVKGIGGSGYECINSVVEANNGEYIAVGYFSSDIMETDGKSLTNAGENDGMILKIANQIGVPEVQELTVENSRKEFQITTEVEEIDGVKGGSISGENRKPYEIVKYGDSSKNEIKMTPEAGYEIIKITINGEELIDYEVDEDGSYLLLQFMNVVEDKHIVVTYARTSNKITIVKQDEEGTKLPGAKFKLDQIEERTNPENVIGEIIANGETYAETDTSKEVTANVKGELTNNGEYYFVENGDGSLVPTNSKTYQVANVEGATKGVHNTTANSYIPIDLSNVEGQYVIVVNAEVSSEGADYGYATVTQDTKAPTYNNNTGRFVYISGTSSSVTTPTNYTSIALEGGKTYYLHLGYRKDSSIDTGDDQIVINSIKVYGATSTTYNFASNGQGGYESNNKGKASTTANSYIPIDLRGLTGKYNLIVNANVSSQSGDYGYATVTTTTDRVAYNTNTSSAVRFIYISGTSDTTTTPTDYTTVLQGGSMYYLHLGYYKNSSTDEGEDKFTVNSISISLNDSELYHTEIETNEKGEAVTDVPYGRYSLTELQAPEGYEAIEEPIVIEFRQEGNSVVENNNGVKVIVGENGEFLVENKEKAKVIVHHYLKTEAGEYTTTKVAEDDYKEGKIGEGYTTEPHLDLEKYQLIKDKEGNYIIPDGNNTYYESAAATGSYVSGTQEVIYYYEVKDIPLIVHHYIEGTEDKVPLADGSLAKDETDAGKEGERYTTDALTEEELSEKYELVEQPDNWEGIYTGNSVEVMYYYKVKTVEITTKVEGEGGTITGKGERPYETVEYGEDSIKDIIATPEEGYRVSKITVNGEEIEFTTNKDGTVELDKFIDMKENQEVIVSFEKIPAQIIVHHYIYNKETGEYTEEKVPSKEGGVVEDEIKTGVIGDIYVSQKSEDIAENYEYVEVVGNPNGEMTKEPIEIIYYYQIKDGKITENTIEKTGTEKITKEDQEVSYTISYKAKIEEYIGKAEVTIIDKLPFEITEETKLKIEEMGGVYNELEKTITWTEEIENINTYEETEGVKEIAITKEITVVYKNMDYSKPSFENIAQGRIKLEETKQEEETEEVKVITETEYTKSVEVRKEWDHTNNEYGIPKEVKVQVKNGPDVIAEKVLNNANAIEGNEKVWTWTFTDLPKYNEQGEEIEYTVDEVEVNTGDLKYYKKEINGTTITNTYKGPVIHSQKEMTTENGLNYVVEGEKITYTIRVQNSGDLGQDVVVKDSIPEGTSFVEGSVQVNGVADASKTAGDLANGIRVTVPERTDENTMGEATVSFTVTVNELEGELLRKDIKNTATINKKPEDPESTDEPTNEVTTEVNKSDLKYNKSSNPESGRTVKVRDEITYTIHLDNSKGTAPTSVMVKDTIPTGTSFVEGSIQINGIADASKTADDLASGIKVDLAAGESKEIAFKVTVNDLNNGETIENVATIKENPDNPESPEEPTNETEHTYAEAVVKANKEITTEKGLSYVVEGEKITYTIRVQNSGDLGAEVVIKDSIPEGTSFVEGSVQVNGEKDASKTATDLANGIRVTVPERTGKETPGEATVSFTVKVNPVGAEETSKSIKNTGYIHKTPESPEEPTNEVVVPVLMYKKKAEIIRAQEKEEIPEGSVTAGDRIKYTITIHNVGTEKIEGVEIKDRVPEGTTIYQIYDDGEISLNAGNVITWNVAEIAGGEVKEVSFEVTVNYDNKEKTIQNVATVDDKETNEVETPYIVPELELESSIVKEGIEKVASAEEKVSYTIKYTANIQDFVGQAKVKIVDYLPYTIDEVNSEIDNGIYNAENKTITWEVNVDSIDTYQNAEGVQSIDITKTLLLKYNYPDPENLNGNIDNKAEGTITLTQNKDPEGTEETVKEETVEDKHEVKVEIPAEVIVHHYIYDEAKGGETTQKVPSKEGGVVADEQIEGMVGQSYDTNPTSRVDENYECINVNPEKAEGTMTKEPIEVTYYYQLRTAELGGTIEKTATASKTEGREYETGEVDEQGNPITETKIVEVLTEEDGVVTYKIKYRVGIKNYKGKAKITIVDKLPAELKSEDPRVNLAGGEYNAIDRTITWEEEVEVNTLETGSMYDETIEKEIKVVYQDQNVVETLVNEVTGSTTIYYPEEHSTNPGGERDKNTVKDTAEVEQEYKVAKQVEKVWDDNGNAKGKRPESVTVQLTANGSTNYNGQELEKVILNEENEWRHTFANLPKYTEFGQEIQYSVVETETNEGDLEYYEEPVVTIIHTKERTKTQVNAKIIITNSYKLMETDLETSIEKTGTEKITASKEPVTYNISYQATVTEYIGEVVVKVVDTLPYKIDKANSNLAGGVYNEETNTITWEEKIENVNTYTDGTYEIEIHKTIKVVYSNVDGIQKNMANQVKGTIDLYETEETNTVEDTHDTRIEIPGKVIVKYIDKETGKEITYIEEQEGQEPVDKTYGYEIDGFAGDAYTTEQKEIPGYTYVENSGNTEGNMIDGMIEVIYYYERIKAGGVIVHYEDEEGNKLLEDETIGGKVGDNYTTEQKEIEDYEYVRVEGTPQGELTEGIIEVTYIYRKTPAKVIVRHLEKDNTEEDSDNKELYPQEIIEGHIGDKYTTSRKTIKNYRAAEPEPNNAEGKMTKEDIYVIYYYEKIPSGTVTVKYVDIETKEEILYKEEETGEYKTYKEQKKGYVGENYETEVKEIPYYNLVESLIPTNKKGKYTEEDIEVTYYYQKQEFNMSIEKTIEKIEKDGKEEEGIDQKIDKVEIVGSKVEKTKLKVTYGIKVSNTGEIEGRARVIENIPSNFQVEEGTGKEWRQNEEGKLETEVELKAGETKELKVVLSWEPGENHFGTKENIAEIIQTENPAKYEEVETEDNKSKAEIVITIKTGEATRRVVLIIAIAGMLGAVAVFWYLTEKYNRDNAI